MNKDYDATFEDFLLNLALTKTQAKRIDGSLTTLSQIFLQAYEGDVEIYTQGSFATNTIVRPLTSVQSPSGKAGEYDVDIVFDRENWSGARAALQSLRETISLDGRYNINTSLNKESCERVEFSPEASGVGYHIDLVPLKTTGDKSVAVRTPDAWRRSDPAAIVDWFKMVSSANRFLSPMVLSLKRMRDVAGLQKELPSIVILAFVGLNYTDMRSYADDLLELVSKLSDFLSQPPDQQSLVIPGVPENLAEKFDNAALTKLRNYFGGANAELNLAFHNDDNLKIRKYLSDSFPLHKQPPQLSSFRSKGWNIQLDGDLERPEIVEDLKGARYNREKRRHLRVFDIGQPILFHGDKSTDIDNYLIYWQVLNDKSADEIRGNFFPARGMLDRSKSTDPLINYETVKYNGIHWIRYIKVNQSTGTIEAVSHKHSVQLNLLAAGV